MFSPKSLAIASITAAFIGFYPHISLAEDKFTGTDFLKWSREQQHQYIFHTVGVAMLITNRNDKQQEQCIDDWYYPQQYQGDQFILDTMREHPSYHPLGVVLSVLEKKCGSFSF